MNSLNIDDLKLFSNVVKTLAVDHENYYYIPYYIGSPEYWHKTNKKNDALLPFYILILNKKNKMDFTIETTYINWHSIHYYQVFTFIKKDLTGDKLENILEYKKYFKYEENLTVNPLKTKIIKLKDVLARGFYRDLKLIMNKKLENEVFIEFESKDRTYIVSGVELVRYFYAKAVDNSLLNALFHPEGIALLYNSITITSKEYFLYLKNDCTKDDAAHALYFIHENKFSEWFNEVYIRMRSEHYLYAGFPSFEPFQMSCRTIKYKDCSLIVRIDDSNIHDKISDKELIVTHPNDKDIDRKKLSKSKSKSVKTKTDPENEFDDEVSSISTAPDFIIEEYKSNTLKKKELKIKFVKDKTLKKLAKKSLKTEKSNKTKLTPNDGKGSRKDGTKTKLKTLYYPNEFDEVKTIKFFNSIDKIIEVFETTYSYTATVKSFYFPDKKTSNGKTKEVSISFTDKDKTDRRKYILIRFESLKYKNFIFLDVEEKYKKQKKGILVINNDIDLMKCQEKYITKIIYDQVKEGNHKWLSKNTHGLILSDIGIFDHKYTKIEDLCERIFNYINL